MSELTSILIPLIAFGLSWWPCGACDGGGGGGGPDTSSDCQYCENDTTPEEVTVVLGTGASNNGYCSDANCDAVAGTYILPREAGTSCAYKLDIGYRGYCRDSNLFPSSCSGPEKTYVVAQFSRWASGPNANIYFVEAGFDIDIITGYERPRWDNNWTTTKPDCCDETLTALSLTYRGNTTGHECDYTGVSCTIQCT